MPLFPYKRVTIHSKLDSEQIIIKLKEIVEPQHLSWWKINFTKPFHGIIRKSSFTISSCSDSKLLAPQIKGKIVQNTTGSTIKIIFSTSKYTYIFVLFIGVVMAIISIYSIIYNYKPTDFDVDKLITYSVVWAPLLLIVLIIIMDLVSFLFFTIFVGSYFQDLFEEYNI